MGAVSFQVEAIAGLWSELLPLARDHWREVRWDDTEADPDCARYDAAEAAGAYRLLTARGDHHELGRPLIGYAGYWICPSAQRRGALEAAQDMLYLRPDCRRGWLGAELIREGDRMLAELGVSIVYHHVRTAARDFGPVLQRLGYQPIETTYARKI